MSYLVGVARPGSAREWNEHTRSLTLHHDWEGSLSCVEKIFLPRWKMNECPWCREQSLLFSVANRFPDTPKWISDRIAQLADKENGLNENVFLSIPEMAAASLGSSSDFGPEGITSITTIFSVACAFQELRNEPEQRKRLSPGFPDFKVFNVGKCLERYDEALLRAVFLRLIMAQEWGDLDRKEVAKVLPLELGKADHAAVRGETLLCMHRIGLRIASADFHSGFSEFLPPKEEQIFAETLGIEYKPIN